MYGKMQGFVKQSQLSPVLHKWEGTSMKWNMHRSACEVSVPCRDPNAVKHSTYARALTPSPNPSRWVVNCCILVNGVSLSLKKMELLATSEATDWLYTILWCLSTDDLVAECRPTQIGNETCLIQFVWCVCTMILYLSSKQMLPPNIGQIMWVSTTFCPTWTWFSNCLHFSNLF